jgi:hypothetical protein
MIDVEGLILEDKPLSNFELLDAAKSLKIPNFRGVFVRDELPKNTNKKECGILNTGDSSTGGFHWICWLKDGDEKITFDSYGLPPPTELVSYLGKPVKYNTERLQYGDTTFCGHLCLYILKKVLEKRGGKLNEKYQNEINKLW